MKLFSVYNRYVYFNLYVNISKIIIFSVIKSMKILNDMLNESPRNEFELANFIRQILLFNTPPVNQM